MLFNYRDRIEKKEKMASVYHVVDYSQYPRNLDLFIRKMWERKMNNTIFRNPKFSKELESYKLRQLSANGCLMNIRKVYSRGQNKFFVLLNDKYHLSAFVGFSLYNQEKFELNKVCLSDCENSNDLLISEAIKYYKTVISEDKFYGRKYHRLETVVEAKNRQLFKAMVRNGFVEYSRSKNGVNCYMVLN